MDKEKQVEFTKAAKRACEESTLLDAFAWMARWQEANDDEFGFRVGFEEVLKEWDKGHLKVEMSCSRNPIKASDLLKEKW